MCGINGMVGEGVSLASVTIMCETSKYRGPDHTGTFYLEGKVALGHNRLAILDLSSDSNQPFSSLDGRYHLVFNGEIYNFLEIKSRLFDFHFRTHSDTEVLLAAWQKWGRDCLAELNGMFAFAIWDNHLQTLFAARDRFGVKPFYYSFFQGCLVFSSEINPFFAIGVDRIPHDDIWSAYFVNGAYGKGNETFWKGIYQLEPGNCLTFSQNKLKVETWYNFKDRVEQVRQSLPKDLHEYFKDLLLDSTRLRFRADVPVGFNLSGGLDSSMLFSLIQNQFSENSSIEAFTFYTGDEKYDELPYVEQIMGNSQFKLNAVKLAAEEVPELAYFVSANQQEPFGGLPTIAYSKIFKEARLKGIKVLLDGQGADESWAGYDYYFSKVASNIQGVTRSPYRRNVLVKEFSDLSSLEKEVALFDEQLLNLQYRDIFSTKLARALRFSDRVSMVSSTELREPFLDYRIVEAAFGLPAAYKYRDGRQKWLFREIASEFLDPSTQLAPKRPLQTPQREWLSDDLQDWVKDEVSRLKDVPWFDYKEMEKELNLFFKGDNESSFHVWQWVNTAILLSEK